jgi:hypothetical protein
MNLNLTFPDPFSSITGFAGRVYSIYATEIYHSLTPTFTLTSTPTSSAMLPPTPSSFGAFRATAFPNPTYTRTRFALNLERSAAVRIVLYNVLAERMAELSASLPGGASTLEWNCRDVTPGIYLTRILVDGRETATLKVAVFGGSW